MKMNSERGARFAAIGGFLGVFSIIMIVALFSTGKHPLSSTTSSIATALNKISRKKDHVIEVSFDEIGLSDDVRTPIFLRKSLHKQANSKKTGYLLQRTILEAFFEKYGLTGTKPSESKANKKMAQKISKKTKDNEKVTSKATSEGWAYATIYAGSTSCNGTVHSVAGVRTNLCMNFYKSSDDDGATDYSIMVTCEDDEPTYYLYEDNDCASTSIKSKVLGEVGCSLYNNTLFASDDSDDDTYNDYSVDIKCKKSTTDLPISGQYDVLELFLEDSAGDATCSETVLFEGYPTGTCIPYDTSYSVMYEETDDIPYLTFYSKSSSCSGTGYKFTLTNTCTAYGSTCSISYMYEYYSTESTHQQNDFLHFLAYKYNLNYRQVVSDFNTFIKTQGNKDSLDAQSPAKEAGIDV